MTTYARIVDGFAVDVVITPPELADRYHPEWLAKQTFIVVPDGTIHGAVDNGDGTFTNPVIPNNPESTATLSDLERLQAIVDAIAQNLGVDPNAAISAAQTQKAD